jgi:hypothetical protein
MARKSEEEKRIRELIEQAEIARRALAGSFTKLRGTLNVPARLRSSLMGHPGGWMAGSLVSGLAASLLFRRKPKTVSKSRGIPFAILAMLGTAARPLVKAWLLGRLKHFVTRAQSSAPPSRPVARPLP